MWVVIVHLCKCSQSQQIHEQKSRSRNNIIHSLEATFHPHCSLARVTFWNACISRTHVLWTREWPLTTEWPLFAFSPKKRRGFHSIWFPFSSTFLCRILRAIFLNLNLSLLTILKIAKFEVHTPHSQYLNPRSPGRCRTLFTQGH